MEILAVAQEDRIAIVAGRRISTALSKNVPAAAARTYYSREKVLIYREEEKDWVGTFIVISFHGKLNTVENPDKSYRGTFNLQQLKKSFHNLFKTDAHSDPSEFYHDMSKSFRSENHPKPLCIDFHLTEILSSNDLRSTFLMMRNRRKSKDLSSVKLEKLSAKMKCQMMQIFLVEDFYWPSMVPVRKRRFEKQDFSYKIFETNWRSF